MFGERLRNIPAQCDAVRQNADFDSTGRQAAHGRGELRVDERLAPA
jgi:hypothetical protein